MKQIIKIVNDAIGQKDVKCLPCDRINLDYHNFNEYLDTDEHKAEDIFEYPRPKNSTIIVKETVGDLPPILKYFLDGSRKTYKIADLLVKGKHLSLFRKYYINNDATKRRDEKLFA